MPGCPGRCRVALPKRVISVACSSCRLGLLSSAYATAPLAADALASDNCEQIGRLSCNVWPGYEAVTS